jgi:hypothetical protein
LAVSESEQTVDGCCQLHSAYVASAVWLKWVK